jgi:hypothetical protein
MGLYKLHNGELKIDNLTVYDVLNFGDVSADTFTVNGAATFKAPVTATLTGTNTVTVTQAAMTENLKAVSVSGSISDTTHGARQGVIAISLERPNTSILASWDGNPDCALKISAVNKANSVANGGTRAIDASARNRDAGTESWINCAYLTAENSANTIVTSEVARLIMKNNGIVSTNHLGLIVQDTSQGSGPENTVAIQVTTGTIAPATGIRNKAIEVTDADSTGWTNGISLSGSHLTNVLDFSAADGSNGAKDSAACATTSVSDGAIRIDVNGTPMYVPYYTAAHTAGAW